jgi:hypothetical protein
VSGTWLVVDQLPVRPDWSTMSETQHLSSTLRIAAPAASIFAIIADPQGHVTIDGSGMLIAPKSSEALAAVGDSFLMDMDGPARGFPQLGTYTVRNTVTKLVDGTLLEWTIGPVDGDPYGHVYGFTLAPITDSETEVVHYYDWSAVPADMQARFGFPVISSTGLAATLGKLDASVTGA